MKQLKWLLKRELWEHKGMLLWTPIAVGSLTTLLGAAMMLLTLTGRQLWGQVTITALDNVMFPALDALATAHALVTTPLCIMLGLLVFFYCLGAMHDERRDGSILFWKSLPVSDRLTVASKALTALLVAPLITLAVALAAGLVLLLILCGALALHRDPALGFLLRTPQLYQTLLGMLTLPLLYLLWALPTVGWLLMVSAWARSKVLAWAIGIPLLACLLIYWAAKTFYPDADIYWLATKVIGRAVSGVFPGNWQGHGSIGAGDDVQNAGLAALATLTCSVLVNPALWLGVLAGVAMLHVTVRLRGSRMDS